MTKWIPWRIIVKKLARHHGFLDPLTLYARLQQFSQPSEVAEPIELLRAGAVFHARGLINSRVLQHNLDWVWPYWVERQFDPADVSFMPRAFSLTHVNLTHRNWSAIGLPGRSALPIVDPRGLVTPFWDSWSIDVWCMDRQGKMLLPSRSQEASQWSEIAETLRITTRTKQGEMQLDTSTSMLDMGKEDVCRISAKASVPGGGWLIVSVRPSNPEGISFIDHIELDPNRKQWLINDRSVVRFDQQVQQHRTSHFTDADVLVHLQQENESVSTRCSVGLATAAAMFHIHSKGVREVQIEIPIESTSTRNTANWTDTLQGSASLQVPDAHYVDLFNSAVQTLVLCTPDDVYAGPYTYKRYWYRDAVFIAHGLLSAGMLERAGRLIEQFPRRQSKQGYYHSQEGEWDANGEVLWVVDRFRQLSNQAIDPKLWKSLKKGAHWLIGKRLPDYGGQAHEGLLPAGFSAEHLGPNDHYYWDNFWAQAGLSAAARMAVASGEISLAEKFSYVARQYEDAIKRSVNRQPQLHSVNAYPAAPARRMDAGAIGSIITSYPLQLCKAQDTKLKGTIDFLLANCFYQDGFFQDMIHSGVNAYLTLHVAQALLRADDSRYASLIRAVASLASPTGHWPEAVHPRTGGGCMGDGHHAWAAAEWVAMMRNCFVREEGKRLILGSGVLPEWLDGDQTLSFGPVPTQHGLFSIAICPLPERGNVSTDNHYVLADQYRVSWESIWHRQAPEVSVQLPGFHHTILPENHSNNYVDCKRIVV